MNPYAGVGLNWVTTYLSHARLIIMPDFVTTIYVSAFMFVPVITNTIRHIVLTFTLFLMNKATMHICDKFT